MAFSLKADLASQAGRRCASRNAERLRSNILGVPVRAQRVACSAQQMSRNLASELVQKLPSAALASLMATLTVSSAAFAEDMPAPVAAPVAQVQAAAPAAATLEFSTDATLVAPEVKAEYALPEGGSWRYSEFITAVENGKVERVRFSKDGSQLQLTAVDGRRATVTLPNDPDLAQSGGGGRGAMSFGRSRAKLQGEDQIKVNFSDVAGCDEAKEEVGELVEFLRDPGRFQKLGGKIPRGVLMVGPPGTGKTLLAKAIAGEAKVPFFAISGSDFVEMFVGVGASRVRDMFEQAKKHAPCIIFIDEIDAVGRHRGAGLGGGHDEREQTLNQLLVEMDGFEGTEGIIVIAATNRPDVLDPALLRPGRFDRQVTVGLPDVRGREQILKVHMRKVPTAADVNAMTIARGTPGFSGADLANLVNEAALFAARENAREVRMIHLDKARDKILMGTERRSLVMSEDERKLTAYHESGHAIIGRLVPEHDPVYKISIVPRGNAGGLTFFAPSEERLESGLYSRSYLENQMAVALGGRIAEELIFGEDDITTGASSDFQQVSRIARLMVTQLGFSKTLGQVAWSSGGGSSFMGGSAAQPADFSADTADKIDNEVKLLVERAYRRAKDLVVSNMSILHKTAAVLIDKENIDGEEFQQIILESQAEQYLKNDEPTQTIPYQKIVTA
ncbi:MAG: hypothetical protein WDW36_001829 [Sanguina aurantia]